MLLLTPTSIQVFVCFVHIISINFSQRQQITLTGYDYVDYTVQWQETVYVELLLETDETDIKQGPFSVTGELKTFYGTTEG